MVHEGQKRVTRIVKLKKRMRKEGLYVEYYEPKLGDFVVDVMVSNYQNNLDVDIEAELLGTILKKKCFLYMTKR